MRFSCFDACYLVEQYEALRREATATGAGIGRGHGLVLFLTRGMTVWLEALTALEPPRAPVVQVFEPSVPERGAALTAALRVDLTTVLAGMVLACSEEEVGDDPTEQGHLGSPAALGVPLRAPIIAPASTRSPREHGAPV
jgi:hypothetical protein